MLPFCDKIPALTARYLTRELYSLLPPPADADPETIEARDVVAGAMIARLGPNNTAEGHLAVQAVGAQMQATDCLRAAIEFRDDFKKAAQCRAQAALMMRQAAQALKQLRTLQETHQALLAQRRREEEEQARLEAAQAEPPPAEPTSTETPQTPEPEREFPDLPRFAQAWASELRRPRSQEAGQRPVIRIHETTPKTPPSATFARPSEAALIAALVPGAARAGIRMG